MSEEKTASETLKETFNSAYDKWTDYCEWVMGNVLALELHDKFMNNEPNYDEALEGIPRMDLTMEMKF